MNMKVTDTYYAQIWVGLRVKYTEQIHGIEKVRKICDEFVNDNGDCVTITPTEYRYVNGNEPGAIIGWIQYLRVERSNEELIKRAIRLGEMLMTELEQYRITITTPEKTYMLENENYQDNSKIINTPIN